MPRGACLRSPARRRSPSPALTSSAPSPPFNPGALFVYRGDERGTMVSVEPRNVYSPGPGGRTDIPMAQTPERNAFHGLFEARVSEERIREMAAREDWPCGRMPNGAFEVINLWLEGTQLVESLTPDMVPACLRTLGSEAIRRPGGCPSPLTPAPVLARN